MRAAAPRHAAAPAGGGRVVRGSRPRPAPLGRPCTLVAHARGRKPKGSTEASVAPADGAAGGFPAAGDISPQLADEVGNLASLLPDLMTDENLLDETFQQNYGGATAFQSGSNWDWNAPPGGQQDALQDWGSAGLDVLMGSDGAGGLFGNLSSADPIEDFANEVGEGSSFRREQLEQGPFRSMAYRAHAAAEEQMSGDAQTRRQYLIERGIDYAMAAQSHFREHGGNKYAWTVALGAYINEEEFRGDRGLLLPELGAGAGAAPAEALPTWCRATIHLAANYDAVLEGVREGDRAASQAELAFLEEQLEEQLELADMLDADAGYGALPDATAETVAEDAEAALQERLQARLDAAGGDDALAELWRGLPGEDEAEQELGALLAGSELESVLAPVPAARRRRGRPLQPEDFADMFASDYLATEEDEGYADTPEQLAQLVWVAGEERGGAAAAADALPAALADPKELMALPLDALAGDIFGEGLEEEEEEEEAGPPGPGRGRRPRGAAAAASAAKLDAVDDEVEEEEEEGVGGLPDLPELALEDLESALLADEEEGEERRDGRHAPRLLGHFEERQRAEKERDRASAERMGLRPPRSSSSGSLKDPGV